MKEKGDSCILVGYSTKSKGYRVYNKRTRLIVESIHLRFDEIKRDVFFSPVNSVPQDTHPSMNIQPTSEPSTPTNAHAEENNFNGRRGLCCLANGFAFDPNHQKKLPSKKSSIWIEASSKSLDFRSTNLHEAVKTKLDVDLSRLPIDQTRYHSMIGALMYLTSSRLDIVQAVCYCARYPARPTKKHLKEVKRIFRYLKGTINMGLWYSKDSGFELIAFSDADHAGCLDTRKSTYGGIQFLGDKLVSWMSKKQDCTATSSAEAEYVALTTSCAQVM
ncbi:retrovirus-related pol polyprotein from transposon TNT 1-94 [Tanacetum coccineum]